MDAKASATDIHSTPKKLRFILAEIKKMKPVQALDHLMYSPRKSAKVMYKVIKSAIDNAKQTLQIDEHLLEFKLLKIDQGHALKRFNPGGRGTAKPYHKQFAHISVIVTAPARKQTPQKQEKKQEDVKPVEVKAVEEKQAPKTEKKTLKIARKSSPKKKTAVKETKTDGTKS